MPAAPRGPPERRRRSPRKTPFATPPGAGWHPPRPTRLPPAARAPARASSCRRPARRGPCRRPSPRRWRAVEVRARRLRHPFAGVHDPLRVEGLLDPPHESDLDGALVAADLLALGLADAVLGADRAAQGGDDVVDGAVDLGAAVAEGAAVGAGRL